MTIQIFKLFLKKKIMKNICLLLLILICTSCKKDWIQIPTNNQVEINDNETILANSQSYLPDSLLIIPRQKKTFFLGFISRSCCGCKSNYDYLHNLKTDSSNNFDYLKIVTDVPTLVLPHNWGANGTSWFVNNYTVNPRELRIYYNGNDLIGYPFGAIPDNKNILKSKIDGGIEVQKTKLNDSVMKVDVTVQFFKNLPIGLYSVAIYVYESNGHYFDGLGWRRDSLGNRYIDSIWGSFTHLYRGTVFPENYNFFNYNPVVGSVITNNSVKQGDVHNLSYNWTRPYKEPNNIREPVINLDNCNVVAVLYENSFKNVYAFKNKSVSSLWPVRVLNSDSD